MRKGSKRLPPVAALAARAAFTLVIICGIGCSDPAAMQAPAPVDNFDPVLGAKLQGVLDMVNADLSCWGMTAAAWVPGKGMWHGANGRDDIHANTPMPRDGMFRIGSITKTYVATVFLQLDTEGKVSLDDKLSRWVPDFPRAAEVTMRQVMSHTSGIYNYSENLVLLNEAVSHPTKVWTPKELLSYAASQPYYFDPGAGFHYSNTDYILVALAVEAATGNAIHKEIRARILDKLGFKATYFASAEMPPKTPVLVHGYDDGGRDLTNFYDMSASWAAGAIAANADDVTRFMIALQTGQLLDQPHLAEMRKIIGGGYYGLGLMHFQTPLGEGIGHDGLVIGYWTQSAWFEKSGAALSVLCDVITVPRNSPIKSAWNGIATVLAAELAH